MVIVKIEKLKEWLNLTGRNQAYLAEQSGVTNGYISQILNGAPCSGEVISSLLDITKFEFENLFIVKETVYGVNHPKHNFKKFRKKWQT